MKRLFYLSFVMALLAGGSAQAQITPEVIYQGGGPMIRMSTGDYKYQMIRSATKQVTLYNLNHSIYKQFTIPAAPAGFTGGYASYISDALFDTNTATVEYLVQYSYANRSSGEGRVIVYSETGTQLAVMDSVINLNIYNTPSGTKMLAEKVAYDPLSGATLRNYTRVYSLGGQLALRTASPQLMEVAGAYPNPARGIVTLPYTIPAGEVGMMQVFDVTGKLVASYRVDSHINRLEVSTRDLRPGVYLYKVKTSTGVSSGQRFIIE